MVFTDIVDIPTDSDNSSARQVISNAKCAESNGISIKFVDPRDNSKKNAVNELGTMNKERREDREKPMKANYQLEQNMGDRDAKEHSRIKLIWAMKI